MNNIPHSSFLTISNALKQFPVLNSITPEAHARPVCFIKLKYYIIALNERLLYLCI